MKDIQVIAQVRDGNTDAFGEIVEHYQVPIGRYIYRMTGDHEVAKDLTQDTFLKAYKGILKTNSNLSFKAWLYRIATNNALQYHRRRNLLSFIPFSTLPKHSSVFKAPPDQIEDKIIIKQILYKISPDQRVCLILHFVEGFKYREIADILGITKDAVCKRVARGSKKFQILYGGG